MKYVVEMGSGAMICYTPGFMKIRSDIQKLMGGGYTHTDIMVIS
jgi:hypothetical protein